MDSLSERLEQISYISGLPGMFDEATLIGIRLRGKGDGRDTVRCKLLKLMSTLSEVAVKIGLEAPPPLYILESLTTRGQVLQMIVTIYRCLKILDPIYEVSDYDIMMIDNIVSNTQSALSIVAAAMQMRVGCQGPTSDEEMP